MPDPDRPCRHRSYLRVAKLMLDFLCVSTVQPAPRQPQRRGQADAAPDRLTSGDRQPCPERAWGLRLASIRLVKP